MAAHTSNVVTFYLQESLTWLNCYSVEGSYFLCDTTTIVSTNMSGYTRIKTPPEGEQEEKQEGYRIPRREKKSLTDSINDKLIAMASKTTEKSNNFSCGKKRTFEETSISRAWAKDYDKQIPESLMEQCGEDLCNICQVEMTSSIQRRQHYVGSRHEKKINQMLSKIFTELAEVPKKRKLDEISTSDAAAELFLKKLENQVERDPSQVTYGELKLDSWQSEMLSHWDCPLPPAILSLCRLSRCDLCSLTFTSVVMARSHFEGKNHDKKLRAALEHFCGKYGLQVPRKHEDKAAEFERFCRICQVELTSDSMARLHFAGKKHVDKQLKLMSGRAPSSTSSTSDFTGRFSIETGLVSEIKAPDFTKDEDEELKQSLEATGDDGGGGEGNPPVPLMSLEVSNPFDNKSDQFFCPLCNVQLNSRLVYDQHVAGKAHRKKQMGSGGNCGELRCEVCNLTLTSKVVYDDHIRGKQHQKKVAGGGEGTEGQHSCDICLVQCSTEDQLESHLSGKSHQKKAASRIQGGPGGFKCAVCNIATTDQNGLTQHLNGKAHQAMLRRGGYYR